MENESELYFKYLINKNLPIKYAIITQEIEDRIKTEFNVIKAAGFINYFLIVYDIVRYARSKDFLINIRGSAAGSIICYLLDISRTDPLKYKLLFERFLNADRISMPDIDLDIEDLNRQDVLEYIEQKYGVNHVCSIAAFNTLKEKILIQDVGRVLDIHLKTVEKLKGYVREETELADLEKDTTFMLDMKNADPRYFDIVQRLLYSHRNTTIHAGGIIISDSQLDDVIPMFRSNSTNRNIAQYEGSELESMGYLKVDVLGLKTLGIIKRCIEYIKQDTGEILDVFDIPLNDQMIFDKLNDGQTFGVFQLSGHGFTEFVKQIYIENFENIVDLLALYRPGCLDSGMANEYIHRKNFNKPYDKPYEDIQYILKDTYGVILYQEQIMMLMQTMGGFNLREADTVRKAISKKDKSVMDASIEKFKIYAYQKYDSAYVDKMVLDIVTFARYGFNKSHAVSYAYLTYWTAYLMFYYAPHYIAAMLNAESESDKQKKIIEIANNMGIKVLPANINMSSLEYVVVKDVIYSGIASVKNIGKKSADVIIADREFYGNYRSYDNFCERLKSTTITVKKALIIAGAFNDLCKDKLWLFNNAKNINAKVNNKKAELVETITAAQMLKLEVQFTGQQANDDFNEEMEHNFHALGINGDSNYVGGIVNNIHELKTTKGDMMAFVTVKAVKTSSITFFPEMYQQFKSYIEEGNCLVALVKKSIYKGKESLIANDIKNYDEIVSYYKLKGIDLK